MQEPDTKKCTLYDPIYVEFQNRQSCIGSKQVKDCQQPEGGERGVSVKEHERKFGGDGNV